MVTAHDAARFQIVHRWLTLQQAVDRLALRLLIQMEFGLSDHARILQNALLLELIRRWPPFEASREQIRRALTLELVLGSSERRTDPSLGRCLDEATIVKIFEGGPLLQAALEHSRHLVLARRWDRR